MVRMIITINCTIPDREPRAQSRPPLRVTQISPARAGPGRRADRERRDARRGAL